jgi:origin recognition complex subunit 4
LLPWKANASIAATSKDGKAWQEDWEFAVDVSISRDLAKRQMLLKQDKLVRYMSRLVGLTTDVRNLYRPFVSSVLAVTDEIPILSKIIDGQADFISVPAVTASVLLQIDGAGWGVANDKLKGLSQPALTVLVVAKHLQYAGKEDFNFAQVGEEYLRFSRTRLVGSGRGRWPLGVLRGVSDDQTRVDHRHMTR